MNNVFSLTSNKIEDPSPNEDSVIAQENILAVSDGAGGCGIFAKEWSQYLLEKLPEQPFGAFSFFQTWTDTIWEEYYIQRQEKMENYDCFVKNKFDNEGSYATLAVAWLDKDSLSWACYGDSAIFIFDSITDSFRFMSQPSLIAYENNPLLINWKDMPKEKGYRYGTEQMQQNDIVIVASDALSCYITMSYYVYKEEKNIEECIISKGKLSSYAQQLVELSSEISSKNFYKDILLPLFSSNSDNFKEFLTTLYRKNMLLNDDYSIAIRKNKDTSL